MPFSKNEKEIFKLKEHLVLIGFQYAVLFHLNQVMQWSCDLNSNALFLYLVF